MKLAVKLAAIMALGTCVVLVAFGYRRVEREAALFERDTRRDHQAAGRTLAAVATRLWQEHGAAAEYYLLGRPEQDPLSLKIRWVALKHSGPGHWPRADPKDLVSVLQGQPLTLLQDGEEGEARAMLSYFPVKVRGKVRGAVELFEVMENERRYILGTVLRSMGAGVAVVLICGALALGLGYWIVGRPVKRLLLHLRRIADGDLSGALELGARDELGQLGQEVDTMTRALARSRQDLERKNTAYIEATEQLRHAERLLAVGKLASGIAHELGTPLNVVTARAELLAANMAPDDEIAAGARIIHRQATRMAAIIQKLLDFARRRPPDRVLRDLREVAQQAVHLLSSMAQEQGVDLVLEDSEEAICAEVDSAQLQQVLTSLILNGVLAMPGGGSVFVAVKQRSLRPPDDPNAPELSLACVEVTDVGSGIPPEILGRIFEPFYTTRDVGQGAGLGLAVCHGIVAEHGGWIAVQTAAGQGTTFTVCLPLP